MRTWPARPALRSLLTRPLSAPVVVIPILALLAGAACGIAAAEPVSHPIGRALQSPRIDGELDDPCWRMSPPFETFRPLRGGEGSPSVATRAVLAYDDEAFYVAFRCDEPAMAELRALVTERDGPVWQDDCVELFLGTSGTGGGYAHLAVNANGVVRDAWRKPGMKEDLGWDSGATAAVSRDPGGWSVEIALPIDSLPLLGERPTWVFQLARSRSSDPRHLTMLSSHATGYHVPSQFEALDGFELHRPIRVVEASLGERLAGANRADVVLRNERGSEAEVTLRVAVAGGDAVERTVRVPAGGGEECGLSWDAAPETRSRVRLGVYWRGRYMGGLDEPLEAPPALGELGRRTLMLEPGRPVTLDVPVSLASASRPSAELRWELRDANDAVHASGTVLPEGTHAALPLERIRPGRYELRLTLGWGAGESASRRESIYIVDSPFAPWPRGPHPAPVSPPETP